MAAAAASQTSDQRRPFRAAHLNRAFKMAGPGATRIQDTEGSRFGKVSIEDAIPSDRATVTLGGKVFVGCEGLENKAERDVYEPASGEATSGITTAVAEHLMNEVKWAGLIDCAGFPFFLRAMQSLRFLWASRCENIHLRNLPLSPALRFLRLENCGLTQFPRAFAQYGKLVALNLARNNISSLPPWVWRLYSVRSLNLSHNDFHTAPISALMMPSLTHLDASSNPFERDIDRDIEAAKTPCGQDPPSRWTPGKCHFYWERARVVHSRQIMAAGLGIEGLPMFDRNLVRLMGGFLSKTDFFDGQEEKMAAGEMPRYLGDHTEHLKKANQLRKAQETLVTRETGDLMTMWRLFNDPPRSDSGSGSGRSGRSGHKTGRNSAHQKSGHF